MLTEGNYSASLPFCALPAMTGTDPSSTREVD
jgi:hypothetical protein